MAKRKPAKKRPKKRPPHRSGTQAVPAGFTPPYSPGPVPGAPLAVERVSANVGRLLGERQFASLDEANAFLGSLGPHPTVAPATTPLQQAQDLMYDAWEAPTRREAVALAKRALALSPDCADGYVVLAQQTARSAREAHDLYAAGVAAGERALGPVAFEEYDGRFWGAIQTRGYMRARAGLAGTLWQLGERDAALEHFRALLRLNPGDNQGIRYILATLWLSQQRDSELLELLAQYPDDASALWLYTRALVLFRLEGDSRHAARHLDGALRTNPHVPEYLIGRRPLPRTSPQTISFGGEDEAVYVVEESGPEWLRTPGAMEWLERRWARTPGAKQTSRDKLRRILIPWLRAIQKSS